jgi:hypothetical protein
LLTIGSCVLFDEMLRLVGLGKRLVLSIGGQAGKLGRHTDRYLALFYRGD